MELTYEQKQKRLSRNRTVQLYTSIRKWLLEAKKARQNDNFEQELQQLDYTLYAVTRRMTEIQIFLDNRKPHNTSIVSRE